MAATNPDNQQWRVFAEQLERELLAAHHSIALHQDRISALEDSLENCTCGAADDEDDEDEQPDEAEPDDQDLGDQMAQELLDLPATQLSGHQRGTVENWLASDRKTEQMFRELLAIHDACAREAALRG